MQPTPHTHTYTRNVREAAARGSIASIIVGHGKYTIARVHGAVGACVCSQSLCLRQLTRGRPADLGVIRIRDGEAIIARELSAVTAERRATREFGACKVLRVGLAELAGGRPAVLGVVGVRDSEAIVARELGAVTAKRRATREFGACEVLCERGKVERDVCAHVVGVVRSFAGVGIVAYAEEFVSEILVIRPRCYIQHTKKN